jgi:Mce-associated membrane protein
VNRTGEACADEIQFGRYESLTSKQAATLVFVNQTTTSLDKPSPTTASSSVRVGLAKVDGNWLINRFDPL